MKKLNLSDKAREVVKKLMGYARADKMGYIAAIDPQTAEVFYGKSIVEAAKTGRKIKTILKQYFSLSEWVIHPLMFLKQSI